jgi:hypothetical protein
MTDDPFPDDFGALDRMGQDYKPQQSGQLPGADVLQDGAYDFEVVRAELTKTSKSQSIIFKMQLRVLAGSQTGLILERASFPSSQESLDRLGGDLLTLGVLDASQWGKPGHPTISQGLVEAGNKIKGVKFRGAKTTRKADKPGEKDSHNIWINAVIAGHAMPAPSPGFNECAQPAVNGRAPQPAAAAADPIPW